MLNLHGTKYGCGIGQCGACTVHLNGVAVQACLTPISTVGAKRVTTIEGLSADGTHPVQIAWQDIDVPQCGYCQAGQIMSAAALLAKNAKPTDSRYRRRHERQSLPLRNLSAHPQGGPQGGRTGFDRVRQETGHRFGQRRAKPGNKEGMRSCASTGDHF